MTVTAQAEMTPTNEASISRYGRRRRSFGGYVAARIGELQTAYLKEASHAVAAMARLRASVGRPPGSEFAILELTQVRADHLGDWVTDEPTRTEHAMHTALTVYAVHQQSIHDAPMHRDGPGLGTAISLLSRTASSPEAVRRRFAALGTSTTYATSSYHLRSLVRLLRDHRIALDYGLLADDLVRLQYPSGSADVRALWGRDFYRAPMAEHVSSDHSSSTADRAVSEE